MGHVQRQGEIMTNKAESKKQVGSENKVVLIDIKGVTKMMSVSRSTILRLDDFPKPIKLGRACRWRVSDLQAYIRRKAA